MAANQNAKRIWIFLGFAFCIPWAAALAIYLTMSSNLAQAVATANIVFIATPWLANILTRLVTREGWGNLWLRPNFKRGWPAYLAVWFLPLVAVIVGGGVFYLLFPQSFDPNLSAIQNLVQGTPSAAANPWLILVSMTLSLVIISTPINMVVSLGEEFGWRAYLLPKLMKGYTGSGDFDGTEARKAALLTGLIHGVWHWPLLFMGIRLVPGATFLTPVVYLVFVVAMSVLLSWATLRSGSVWPAALGHGAINAASALPGYLLAGAPVALLGPDPTGLIGGIGFTLLALSLLFGSRVYTRRKAAGPAQAAPSSSSL